MALRAATVGGTLISTLETLLLINNIQNNGTYSGDLRVPSLFRVIGQKELVKTAVVVEISTPTAVISFLKEDTGWTKRVGENACNS